MIDLPNLTGVADTPAVRAAGWTLVHFTWEGALVAIALAVALGMIGRADPQRRYAMCLVALAALIAAPIVTWTVLFVTLGGHVPVEGGAALTSAWSRLEPALPWLVAGWAIGTTILHARLLLGWLVTQRLRRTSTAPPARWALESRVLAARLSVRKAPPLRVSDRVRVPMLVGWLAPMVLVPVSALTALTPAQLRAIVAHELAHVRRRDHLVNLVQAVVEAVLFYHPAVWWVSSRLRAEREYCCDDIVVDACGDAIDYARALARLEELRSSGAELALASTGGPLMSRIVRLVQAPTEPGLRRGGFVAPLIAAVVLTTSIAAAAVSLDRVAPPAHLGQPQVDYAALVKQYDEQRAELVAVLEAAGIGTETIAQVLEEGGASKETLDAFRRAMKHEQAVRQKVEPIVAEVHAALDAGEITEEQAHARLTELHEAIVKEYHQDLQKRRELELKKQHDLMATKLKQAVADGRITEAQAREKMIAFVHDLKRKIEPELHAKARHAEELAKVKKLSAEVKAAFEAGKITRDEAAAKLEKIHQHAIVLQAQLEREQAIKADPQVQKVREHLARRGAELKAAYRAGDMTREQVEKALHDLEADYARAMSKSHGK